MGKLELVKYTFKDVVTHKEVYEWFPDPKVLLIIAGEAVGCLDLSHIDSTSVVFMGDSILVNLPEPEFCYVKSTTKIPKSTKPNTPTGMKPK